MMLLRSPALLAALLLAGCTPGAAQEPRCASTPPPREASTTTPAPTASATPKDPLKPAAAYSGLGAESVSPETIARFTAPQLAPSVSQRIQRLLDIRGAGAGILTSKADRLVFSWNVTGTQQVWRLDGPMKYPVQLTGGEDQTRVVGLTHDDRWVIVSRDEGGQENPGLFLMSIDGGALREIHKKPKVQTFFSFVSDDDAYIYYKANDVKPDSFAIYRWEIKAGKRELVFDEPGLWEVADHRGDELLLEKALGSRQSEFYRYDLKSRKLEHLFGQGETVEYSAQFGQKPGTLLVRHDKGSDFHRLHEWAGGKFTPISPEAPHEVAGFSIDQARKRIAYVMNEDGYEKVHVLDAKTYKELPLPKLPAAENVWGGGFSRDGRHMTLLVDGATLVPTAFFYDWDKKSLTQWRAASTPEVDVSRFAKASLETYPARDGAKIPMFVWRPASCDAPCPVIVHFHGGPESQSTPGFSAYQQLFVDAGFVFVEPNVRGSTGYGKKWLDADNGPKRLEVITDIEDASIHIKKAWAKDGKAPRVGVLGGSYGGYATLMAMTYFAGAYDAGVSEVGIANLVTFLQNTAPYRRILRTSEYGDPDKDRDALVELSPITYVDRVKSPLLVIQGVNDPRVPVGEALQIHAALEARQVPVGLILFADEGHGTSKRGNKVQAIGHTLAFFEKHLK